jgi:hypothetical protein
VNRYEATLVWTPPSVDMEEERQVIQVSGGEPFTVRKILEIKVAQIEKATGWACDLKIQPVLALCPKKLND